MTALRTWLPAIALPAITILVILPVASGQQNDDPSESHAQPPSKPGEPSPEVASWQEQVNEVIASRSAKWRRTHLARLSAELSQKKPATSSDDDLALLELLELTQWALKDAEAARKTLQKRYALAPERYTAVQLAEKALAEAQRYGKRGFSEAARTLYAQVSHVAPDHPKAPLADKNIGIILRRDRRFKEAEQHFLTMVRKYATSNPEYARQSHYLAGDCAWRAGDMSRAGQLFKEVEDRYPDTPEADDARHMRQDVGRGERPDSLRPQQPSQKP